MLCFDNSVLARFARSNPDPNVVAYLKRHASETWAVPATVLFEYLRYFGSQSQIQRNRYALTQRIQRVLPLTEAVAVEAAILEDTLAGQNVSLNLADLLHAATAREAGATFVTCDANDFDKGTVHSLLDLDVIDVS